MSTTKTFNDELWTFPCDLNVKAMRLAEHPLEEIITLIARTLQQVYPDTLACKAAKMANTAHHLNRTA